MQKENYVIDKIEMLRKKRNLSRYRLARRSGLALSSVSNLLNRNAIGIELDEKYKKCPYHLYFRETLCSVRSNHGTVLFN